MWAVNAPDLDLQSRVVVESTQGAPMEPPRRSADQVAAAAAAMDRARAAGLPDDLVTILLSARRAWWAQDTPDALFSPWPDLTDLARAAAHPSATLVDEVVVRVIRRRLSS